jgi:hypothetical protein
MIMDYEKCPRKFYYATYLGLRLPQSMKHLDFGNAIHEAIGNIYDQFDEDVAWTHAEKKFAKQAFERKFTLASLDPNEQKLSGELVYPTEKDRVEGFEEMRDDGISIIDAYWNEKEVLLAEHGICPVRLEIPVKIPVKNLATGEFFEIPVSCRIDAENKDNSTVELKTSKARYDERETRKSPQSLIYTLVKYQQTGKILPLTYVVMLKGRVGNDKIQVIRYEYDEADLLSFMTRIESFIENVRLKRFDKPTRDHERWCDCQKFDKLFENAI